MVFFSLFGLNTGIVSCFPGLLKDALSVAYELVGDCK